MRRSILMTDGSSTSARQAITCLGKQHTIDFVDPSALCQCRFSTLVRKWHRCPSFSKNPQAYFERIVELIERYHYDVLFPTHEQIFLLSFMQQALPSGVAVALPSFDALQRTISKVKFAECLAEVGLPQPDYQIVRDANDWLAINRFPFWVKLDYATAGQGVWKVNNVDERTAIAAKLKQRSVNQSDGPVLAQQHSAGQKRAIGGVFQRGHLVAAHACQSRSIGVGGSANAKISIDDPMMVGHLTTLGQALQWHGAIWLEYFFDRDRGYQIIECNPRIGETVMAMESGVNLCQALVDVSLNAPLEMKSAAIVGTKTHLGFLTLIAKSLAGATRRDLAAEICKAARSQGDYENSRDEITRWKDDWLSALPYLGVMSMLLIKPSLAATIVRKTVGNYSLTAEGVQAIRGLAISTRPQ